MTIPLRLGILAAGSLALYLVFCWVRPTKSCPSCLDTSRILSQYCSRCKGSGWELRWGARLLRRKGP